MDHAHSGPHGGAQHIGPDLVVAAMVTRALVLRGETMCFIRRVKVILHPARMGRAGRQDDDTSHHTRHPAQDAPHLLRMTDTNCRNRNGLPPRILTTMYNGQWGATLNACYRMAGYVDPEKHLALVPYGQ